MDVTKPNEFMGFGAMDVTKPYEFTGFAAANRFPRLPPDRLPPTRSPARAAT